MMRRHRTTWLMLLGTALLSGCAATGQETTVTDDVVTVPLGDPPETVTGHDWPTRDDGSSLDAAAVERPHTLVARIEDQEVLRSTSQLSFMLERGGVLVEATATPLEAATDLTSAIDATEALLGENGLLTGRVRDDLERFRDHEEPAELEWPESRRTLRTFAEGDQVRVEIELRPTGEDDWLSSVTVGLPSDGQDLSEAG